MSYRLCRRAIRFILLVQTEFAWIHRDGPKGRVHPSKTSLTGAERRYLCDADGEL